MSAVFRDCVIAWGLLAISLVVATPAAAQLFSSEKKTDDNSATDDVVPPRNAIQIKMEGPITGLSFMMLKRRFQSAVSKKPDVIVIEIDSPGGSLDATYKQVDMIRDAKDIEVIALVRKEAMSGAAITALACDRIVMEPDARIGDAGVIFFGPDGLARYAPEKARSDLAQRLRVLAKQTGRPQSLAEKMVDKDITVYSVKKKGDGSMEFMSDVEWDSMTEEDQAQWERGPQVFEATKGKFFTVTGKRAAELGFAEQEIPAGSDMAEQLNLKQPVPLIEQTALDTTIMVLNWPFITILLLVIGLSAIVFEFSAPGIGIGALTAIVCFGLFFWSRFLGGTAGWLEVMLFVMGFAFIALEIFVIPGFGIAGIGGIAMIVASLVLASTRVVIP
ncbi:MAG: peptidase, partial [Planctomycetota bacterium]